MYSKFRLYFRYYSAVEPLRVISGRVLSPSDRDTEREREREREREPLAGALVFWRREPVLGGKLEWSSDAAIASRCVMLTNDRRVGAAACGRCDPIVWY